jgi:hypothetical protein
MSLLPKGEVVEVGLANGQLAYVQYAGKGNYGGGSTYVRVLQGTFLQSLARSELGELVKESDRYCLYTSLPYRILENRMTRRGKFEIPEDRKRSPIVRRMLVQSERNPEGWSIIDSDGVEWSGREFSERHPEMIQRNLSVGAVFDATTVVRMLEQSWEPSVASSSSMGVKRS